MKLLFAVVILCLSLEAQTRTFTDLRDVFREKCNGRLGADCIAHWDKPTALVRKDYLASTVNFVSAKAKLSVAGELQESTFQTKKEGDDGIIRFSSKQCDECFTRCKDISNDLEKAACNTACYLEPGRKEKIASCNLFNAAVAGKIIGSWRLKDMRISGVLEPVLLNVNCAPDLSCAIQANQLNGGAKLHSGKLEFQLEFIPAVMVGCLPGQSDYVLPAVDFRFPEGTITANAKIEPAAGGADEQFQLRIDEFSTTIKLHVPNQLEPIKAFFTNYFNNCPTFNYVLLALEGGGTQFDIPMEQKIPAANSPIKLGGDMKLELSGILTEYKWLGIANEVAVGAIAEKQPKR